jgi:hypothetical protein
MYTKILRCLAPLTAAMILVSAGWTAWNTVALIGTRNPLGYGVAVFFDAAWLVAVAVQHELRYRVDLRVRLSAVGWSLAALAAGINAASELLGRHGVAVAVIAALVPLLAKGALTLKLFTELNSSDAKARFTALTQSWADQLTELRIGEAMGAQWHKVERLHENADAARLAVTQADRLANLELTSGTELPVTRTADPVVWERPPSMPLAPLFQEPAPVTEAAPETAVETVPVPRTPFGFATPSVVVAHQPAHHDAPQVDTTPEIAKSTAILAAASALGSDAKPSQIADLVRAQHGLDVEPNYVRTVLSREAKKNGGHS